MTRQGPCDGVAAASGHVGPARQGSIQDVKEGNGMHRRHQSICMHVWYHDLHQVLSINKEGMRKGCNKAPYNEPELEWPA